MQHLVSKEPVQFGCTSILGGRSHIFPYTLGNSVSDCIFNSWSWRKLNLANPHIWKWNESITKIVNARFMISAQTCLFFLVHCVSILHHNIRWEVKDVYSSPQQSWIFIITNLPLRVIESQPGVGVISLLVTVWVITTTPVAGRSHTFCQHVIFGDYCFLPPSRGEIGLTQWFSFHLSSLNT